jgi:hypothetical protein
VNDSISCRLCGGKANLLFTRTVLHRHEAGYHQCATCGLTQTQEPDWLDEAYADAISAADTGLLARNLYARVRMVTFLALCGAAGRPGLDWAGGYGVFTRLMRDVGFDYHWCDAHARNLFAQGFEWAADSEPPFVVTAFEVLEHLVHPREAFHRIADCGAELIVTSTELHPGSAPSPDWFYLAPETGQHVAFWRADTLARLGAGCGYPCVLAGSHFQVFSRRPFGAWRWHVAQRLGPLVFPLLRRTRRSLTTPDSEHLRRAAGPR